MMTHTKYIAKMVVGTMIGCVGLLGGCASYTNVPVPESAPAYKDVNHSTSIEVIASAISAVYAKHPVDGQYAINLPAGTSVETFERVIAQLPEGAVIPFEGMNADMPVFHIGRIWIRALDAKVDVIYPFQGMAGTRSEQNVTVWLSSSFTNWRSHRMQHWAPGTVPTPSIYVPVEVVEVMPDEPVAEPTEADGVETEAAKETQENTHVGSATEITPD